MGQTKLIKDHHEQELTKYEEIRKTLETEKKDLERKLEEAMEADKKKESILLDFEKQVKRVNTSKDAIK